MTSAYIYYVHTVIIVGELFSDYKLACNLPRSLQRTTTRESFAMPVCLGTMLAGNSYRGSLLSSDCLKMFSAQDNPLL